MAANPRTWNRWVMIMSRFEPVWNRQYISYVQIDVPETLSIEGRADFYDHTGARPRPPFSRPRVH